MLLQFTVENFKSFDEATNFSMRAGKDKDHVGHLIGPSKFQAVRGAAIYGANAAGKSNLVLAMHFARELIVRGRTFGQAIEYSPFELCDDEAERPSGFHWYFVHAGKVWSYGFDILRRRVVEEYLYVRDEKGGPEANWFTRTTDEKGETKIKPGTLSGNKKLKKRLQDLEVNMAKRPEQPFLTMAIENSVEELMPIYDWFDSVLVVVRAESPFDKLLSFSYSQKEFLSFLSEFVRMADTGIERLVVEEEDVDEGELIAQLPGGQREMMQQVFAQLEANEMVAMNMKFLPIGFARKEDGHLVGLSIRAEHCYENGKKKFHLDRESEGTQRLLHLSPILFAFKVEPRVVVIDEMERRLHTRLTQRFVEMALQDSNRDGNQLIFTTHDTNLLDSSLLRRDEIYFARKKQHRTQLERLSEYQIRSDRDYEKAYELGRIGGGGPRLSYEMFGLMEEDEPSKAEVPEVAAS